MSENPVALQTSRLPALPFDKAWRLGLRLLVPLIAYYAILIVAQKSGRGLAVDLLFPLLATFFVVVYIDAVNKVEGRVAQEVKPFSLSGALMGAGMALVGLAIITAGLLLLIGIITQTNAWPDTFPLVSWQEFLRSRAVALGVAAKEEIIFRALLLRWLLTVMRPGQAVLTQAVLFGAEHWVFGPFSILNATLVGITLGILYLRTNNLWVVIGFHFAWDFFTYLLAGGVSAYTQSAPATVQADLGTLYLAAFVVCQASLIFLSIWVTRRPGRVLRPI
jgi:membrane protease YdiL (CAAX protease family)